MKTVFSYTSKPINEVQLVILQQIGARVIVYYDIITVTFYQIY